MDEQQFFKGVVAVANANPLRDLAYEVFNSGVDENTLNEWLHRGELANVGDPIKVNLHGEYRTARMNNGVKPKPIYKINKRRSS